MLWDIRTALWLRTRHFAFGPVNLVLICTGWLLYVAVAAAAAVYARGLDLIPIPMALDFLTLVWLLWALLPAFGGGGELDRARYLDVYPTRRTFMVSSGIFAAVLDLQYLLVAPWVVVVLYTIWGPAALPLTVLFIVGAVLLGQVCIWLVTASPRRQWLTMTGLAVLLVIAAVTLRADPRWGPPGWLVQALTATTAGPRWAFTAALCLPIALFALVIGRLARLSLLARGERVTPRIRARGFGRVPVSFQVHLFGIWRSNTARVTLFSCVLVPLVVGAATPGATVVTVLTILLMAGGAAVSTNSYAYDHTGTLSLLAWPRSRRHLLTARGASVMLWLLLLCAPATLMSLAAGLPLIDQGGLPAFLAGVTLAAVAVTVAGLGTTVRRPAEADHDSIRVRPAPIPSVLGYGLRMMVLLALLAPIRTGGAHPGIVAAALAVFAAICTVIIWRAYRALLDGSALCAAFKA